MGRKPDLSLRDSCFGDMCRIAIVTCYSFSREVCMPGKNSSFKKLNGIKGYRFNSGTGLDLKESSPMEEYMYKCFRSIRRLLITILVFIILIFLTV